LRGERDKEREGDNFEMVVRWGRGEAWRKQSRKTLCLQCQHGRTLESSPWRREAEERIVSQFISIFVTVIWNI
jgi:hypothetical protein